MVDVFLVLPSFSKPKSVSIELGTMAGEVVADEVADLNMGKYDIHVQDARSAVVMPVALDYVLRQGDKITVVPKEYGGAR